MCKEKTRLLFALQGERRCVIIKVIINLPTDEQGKNTFYEQFAKLQAKLVVETIKNLNADDTSKKNISLGVLETLKKQITEVKNGK